MIDYIANNCPHILKKLEGKVKRGSVFHSEVNKILGKEDCNLTTDYLDDCEAELTKKKPSTGQEALLKTAKLPNPLHKGLKSK